MQGLVVNRRIQTFDEEIAVCIPRWVISAISTLMGRHPAITSWIHGTGMNLPTGMVDVYGKCW